MEWLSLIPAGLSLLSGFMGGGKNTSTTTPTLTPEMEKLSKDVLKKATGIWKTPYKAYTGQRVAGPTASRAALTPIMSQMGDFVKGGFNDASGDQARLRGMMAQQPARVGAPTMVPGGVPVTAPVMPPQQPRMPQAATPGMGQLAGGILKGMF